MSDYESDYEYEYESESDDIHEETSEYNAKIDSVSKLVDMKFTDENIAILDQIEGFMDNSIIQENSYKFNNIKVLEFEIDNNIIQYAWTVYCIKLKKYYGDSCIYDINDNLNITFKYDDNGDKRYKLHVESHTNKDLWYPYTAPIITYTGKDKIKLDQYILIMNNEFLVKHKWNICNDLFMFINTCNYILSNEYTYTFNELDNIIYKMISTSNISFTFDIGHQLPSYGEKKIHNDNSSTYNWRSTNENNTMQDLYCIFKDLLNYINTNDVSEYENIITIVCNKYIIADITDLEIMMNECFYDVILSIVKKLNLNIDITYIDSKINIESKTDNEESKTDKITIIENFKSHSFNTEVFNKINNKFIKRVHAELDNIKESLKDYPIFIIGTEQNMHLYKVLFVPEYDTPYAGGYYEFDLYISSDYPNTVPKMRFLTTDNGHVRFNPNLYNCGKVCLSILNTWAQNQWDAKASTIAQILLSVYSMIFCENPLCNEPCDYEALKTESGRKRSNDYNKQIRQENVTVAIKKQLNNENTPFKDIIKEHWNMNKEKTLKTIKEWNLEF